MRSPLLPAAPLLAGLLLTACGGPKPAGLALVFPTDTDKMEATHASILVVQPTTADECPQFLAFPPLEPDANSVQRTVEVDLNNGVASGTLKDVPTGRKTLLVKIQNSGGLLFMRGCRTGNIDPGKSFEINLIRVGTVAPDMTVPSDMTQILDLTADLTPPPDMTAPKLLNVTVTELRDTTRKLENASVTVTDSLAATKMQLTNAQGVAQLDLLGMTPPFTVTALASANGYSGFSSVAGISPAFTSGMTAMALRVELDPPATSDTNAITVTLPDAVATTYYWLRADNVPADIASAAPAATTSYDIKPLATGAHRVVALRATQIGAKDSTVGSSTTLALGAGDFENLATSMNLSVMPSSSSSYTTHGYGVSLVIPIGNTQAAIPLNATASYTGSGAKSVSGLPATASQVQINAQLYTEQNETGTGTFGVVRRQITGSTPSSDAFSSPVPDPPTVPTPGAVTANMPMAITATAPSGITTATAFVHVTVKDGANLHGHILAPAAATTNLTVPGVLPAGSYTADVAFVQNFGQNGTMVQSALIADWTQLIRILPQQLVQSTVTLTFN